MTFDADNPERPDIAAAVRGGNNDLGMENESEPSETALTQALFWQNIYSEILAMEEKVLQRIHALMEGQTPQVRQEVELTNVPVVVAQIERFRSRGALWQARVYALEHGEQPQ